MQVPKIDLSSVFGVDQNGNRTVFGNTYSNWLKIFTVFAFLYLFYALFFWVLLEIGLKVRRDNGNYLGGDTFALSAVSCSQALGKAIECHDMDSDKAADFILKCKETCDWGETYNIEFDTNSGDKSEITVTCLLEATKDWC